MSAIFRPRGPLSAAAYRAYLRAAGGRGSAQDGLGVEFRSLSEDFDTSTANGRLQLSMVLAFSEWWRNSI